jgi:hypothetical protein
VRAMLNDTEQALQLTWDNMRLLTIVLGHRTYPVPALEGEAAREWREKAVEGIQLSNNAGGAFAFLHAPDFILGLVLEYATDISREWVEENATDEEVAIAFQRMFESTNDA